MKKFKVCLCILLFVLLSGCFNQVSPSNKPSTYYISYLNNTVSDNLGNSYEIKKVTKKENFIYLYGYFIFVDFVSLKNMTLMIPNSNNIEIALKQTKSFNLLDDNVDKINYEGNFVIIFNPVFGIHPLKSSVTNYSK